MITPDESNQHGCKISYRKIPKHITQFIENEKNFMTWHVGHECHFQWDFDMKLSLNIL